MVKRVNASERARTEIEQSATEAVKLLTVAAEGAVKTIASAAAEAAKVVASAAAESVKVVDNKNSGDHDLLIELKTRMEGLKEDIKALMDGSTIQNNDHEIRITALENSRLTISTTLNIGIGLLTILTSILVYHIFTHPMAVAAAAAAAK